MREIESTLAILLKAFRHFDDENDLARFDALCEAAVRVLEVAPEYEHLAYLKAIFKEVMDDADQNAEGEHLHI